MTTSERTSTALKAPDRLFIGGEWVAPTTAASFDVVDPASEETLYSVAAATGPDVARAAAAARDAFDHGPWPWLTHAERAAYLHDLAAVMASGRAELAALWTSEMGIVHSLAALYVGGVDATYDYYAGLAAEFPFVERHQPTAGGNVGLLVREPVGVVGIIVPWNAPAAAIAYKVAPALLAGCTIVVKVAPEAPGLGLPPRRGRRGRRPAARGAQRRHRRSRGRPSSWCGTPGRQDRLHRVDRRRSPHRRDLRRADRPLHPRARRQVGRRRARRRRPRRRRASRCRRRRG